MFSDLCNKSVISCCKLAFAMIQDDYLIGRIILVYIEIEVWFLKILNKMQSLFAKYYLNNGWIICWCKLYRHMSRLFKGWVKKNLTKWNFVFLISQVQVIGSSKFWCLPPIIPPYLWGIDTRILKIRCPKAKI